MTDTPLPVPGATVLTAEQETAELAVLDVVPAEGVHVDDALAVAGALEAGSPHPIAVAIAAHAAAHVPFWPAMTAVTSLDLGATGDTHGTTGDTGARLALLGSPALLAAHGIALPGELTAAVVDAAVAGCTPVVLAWNGAARAVLVLAEVTAPAPPTPQQPHGGPAWTLRHTVIAVLAAVAVLAGLRRL